MSMRFPRQEYWSRLPFPSPKDPPDPGIKPGSPALQVVFFSTEPPRKLMFWFPLCRWKSEAERLSNLFMVTELVNGEAKILCKVPGFKAHFLNYYTVLILSYHWGFPCRSVGKESSCNAGEPGLIPGLGRSSREGISYPLQSSWASLVA